MASADDHVEMIDSNNDDKDSHSPPSIPRLDVPSNANSSSTVVVVGKERHSLFSFRNKGVYQELAATNRYVEELEALLREHNIPLPEPPSIKKRKQPALALATKHGLGIMRGGGTEELRALMDNVHKFHRLFPIAITYRDINYHIMAPETKISTVGNSLYSMFCGSGPKHRVDILKGLTGRFLPNRMVLVLGPPGCGKSCFMQSLSARLRTGKAVLEGDIRYNGENIRTTRKFLVGKIADYVEQNDTHAATLTVEETIKYAWMSSTGGHHSYGVAKDEKTAAILNDLDAMYSKV